MAKGEWQCIVDGCDDEREAGGVYCRDCGGKLLRPTKAQRQRVLSDARNAAGLCRYANCCQPARGKTLCAFHLERQRQWSAADRQLRRKTGRCRCGVKICDGRWACPECRRANNLDRLERMQRARRAGRCGCGGQLHGTRHCRSCMDRKNELARERKLEARAAGKCVRCGAKSKRYARCLACRQREHEQRTRREAR